MDPIEGCGCLVGPEFFGSLTGECSHCSDGRGRVVEPNTFFSKNKKPKNKKIRGRKEKLLLPQDVKERKSCVSLGNGTYIYIYIYIYVYIYII